MIDAMCQRGSSMGTHKSWLAAAAGPGAALLSFTPELRNRRGGRGHHNPRYGNKICQAIAAWARKPTRKARVRTQGTAKVKANTWTSRAQK